MSELVTGANSARPMLLGVDEAAKTLNVSPSYLNKLRVRGGGPRFCKLGRRVGYRTTDLECWLDDRLQFSTSETQS
jgi:hypothetical protein